MDLLVCDGFYWCGVISLLPADKTIETIKEVVMVLMDIKGLFLMEGVMVSTGM